MCWLYKRKINGDAISKRINVKKILFLDKLLSEPYSKVTIELKENFPIDDMRKILSSKGIQW